MLAKNKIIGIVLAIIFCVSAVTCGIVFGVAKSKPQSGAITGTETSLEGYIGNLLTSSGEINATTYNSLLSKVGAIGSVSSTQNSANINSGTPVVFQMGTAGGNPVYWQVTYRTKDYITIMMTRPYTVEYFNNSGTTDSSGIFAGAKKTAYDRYGNYSRSTARQATQQIYTDMNGTNSVLSQIVVTPSGMASATGMNWQYSSSQQPDAKFNSTYYSHHNALYSYSGSYYSSWTWDKTVYNDMFWLPSFYELYNTSTSSNSFNGGLWGFASQAYEGFEIATFLNSSVTTSWSWLRSGDNYSSGTALRVNYWGSSDNGYVYNTYGIRPAAHLSLSSIASLVPTNNITFNSNGGSSCASISVSSGDTYGTLPTPTRTGYTFAGWYKSSDLSGSAVSSSTIVTEDHTLYAKWTPNTYAVPLDKQSGSGGTSSVTATYGSAMPSATAPTRTGYTFGGYYTGTNGSGTQYYTSTMASAKNWDLTTNTTLYAKWIINSYTITIQATEGGSVSSSGGSINYNQKVNSIAIASAGVAFLYWVRASDNAQITSNPLNETVTKNETYTAVFGASVEGVAVIATKGGIAYAVGDDFESLADTDTIIFTTKPCLTGYTFSHWEDMNGNNLGTEMSIRLQKSLVMDNIITAVYVQSTSNNINSETNNN